MKRGRLVDGRIPRRTQGEVSTVGEELDEEPGDPFPPSFSSSVVLFGVGTRSRKRWVALTDAVSGRAGDCAYKTRSVHNNMSVAAPSIPLPTSCPSSLPGQYLLRGPKKPDQIVIV